MEQGSTAPERPEEASDGATRNSGMGGRLQQAVGAVGERVTGTADTITGVQFRRQFEDFTDAVTTAVVGVHRDQADLRNELENARKSDNTPQQIAALRERQDRLETSSKSGGTSPLVIVFGVVATLALALGIIAVLRTF